MKKPKLRTYITFKDEFAVEEYVKFNKSRHARSLLAQFRLGILPLKIETGRFNNLAVEQRICDLCTTKHIEDEKHFLCNCPLYLTPRQKLYEAANSLFPPFNNLNENGKFIFIMKNMRNDLSEYITMSWNLRQRKLYE